MGDISREDEEVAWAKLAGKWLTPGDRYILAQEGKCLETLQHDQFLPIRHVAAQKLQERKWKS